MKNIVLSGFMGTGKSSVGRCLAKELNIKFIDTDDLIEKEAGLSIAEIFAQYGEDYFRKLESKIIHDVASRSNTIIAVGGGALVNPLNFKALKRNGIIISLSASLDTILARIGKGDERPLVSGGNKKEIISHLLRVREPVYKKADFIIDTTTKSINDIVKEILKTVGRR